MLKFDPNKTYVLSGNWCVSTMFPCWDGDNIDDIVHKYELHVYDFDENNNVIKAPCYGMRFDSSDEARAYAFEQGYLKEYVR